MRSSAERTTGSGGWDDDWGDAFPAAPQTPAAAPKPAAYQQMTPQQQPGAAFAYQPPQQQLTPQQAYQHEAFPQQKWAAQPVPAPAPAPAPGFMQPQQSVQQPQAPQFACGSGGGGGGGSSVMGLDQAAIAGAAAQAMGVDPGAASAMQQVATGMAMNYLGNTASATTAVASSYLTQLRYYFDVNNSYVTQKLKVLALPFRHKEWERTVGAHGRLQPPALDVNAPDLYLPSMAYITYILVVGFVMGANGTFTPDVLGITASAGLMIVLLEVSIIKLAFYLVHGARIPAQPNGRLGGARAPPPLRVCLVLPGAGRRPPRRRRGRAQGGVPVMPRRLEPAASRVADSTAFWPRRHPLPRAVLLLRLQVPWSQPRPRLQARGVP